jgi:hypothetical protein
MGRSAVKPPPTTQDPSGILRLQARDPRGPPAAHRIFRRIGPSQRSGGLDPDPAITRPAVPCMAVATTAGTAAEVTANAVLPWPEHRRKASLRSPLMIPAVTLVDPQLTMSCPPPVTAASGLDALTQCLEPLVSPPGQPADRRAGGRGAASRGRGPAGRLRRPRGPGDAADMAARGLLGGCRWWPGVEPSRVLLVLRWQYLARLRPGFGSEARHRSALAQRVHTRQRHRHGPYEPAGPGSGTAYLGYTPRTYVDDESASAPADVLREAEGLASWLARQHGRSNA